VATGDGAVRLMACGTFCYIIFETGRREGRDERMREKREEEASRREGDLLFTQVVAVSFS
jgi:hypothetical protein